MDEQRNVNAITAEVEDSSATLRALQARVDALETALGELRSVSAGASGRKTTVTAAARTDTITALDAAMTGLSLEQRIAVKSHMLRSGLL